MRNHHSAPPRGFCTRHAPERVQRRVKRLAECTGCRGVQGAAYRLGHSRGPHAALYDATSSLGLHRGYNTASNASSASSSDLGFFSPGGGCRSPIAHSNAAASRCCCRRPILSVQLLSINAAPASQYSYWGSTVCTGQSKNRRNPGCHALTA